MTGTFYKNMIKSIRAFMYSINPNVRWYLDTENVNMTDVEFVEVLSSTKLSEDEILPEVADLININVYSRDDPDNIVSQILEALQNRFIDVLDYEGGTLEKIGALYVRRIDVVNLGQISGYWVKNVSLNIECFY